MNRTSTSVDISPVVTRWHRYCVTLRFADGREERRYFTYLQDAASYGAQCVVAYGSQLLSWSASIARCDQ